MMLSEIVQFHQLVNLVRELNKPVEMSDDSLIALDDDIILLEQQNVELLEALKATFKILEHNYGSGIVNGYWPTIAPVFKQAKQAIAKAEGGE